MLGREKVVEVLIVKRTQLTPLVLARATRSILILSEQSPDFFLAQLQSKK